MFLLAESVIFPFLPLSHIASALPPVHVWYKYRGSDGDAEGKVSRLSYAVGSTGSSGCCCTVTGTNHRGNFQVDGGGDYGLGP